MKKSSFRPETTQKTKHPLSTSLGDEHFADQMHRQEINQRIARIFEHRIKEAPYYWSVDGTGAPSILSKQEMVDSISQNILEGISYEDLILDYIPAESFQKAKKQCIEKLRFTIDELKFNMASIKMMKKKFN